MTAKEFVESKEWTQTTVHFNISDVIDLMQEYARIKCLEAIKNTRYKAIEIIDRNINVEICLPIQEEDYNNLINNIQNIPNENVMPEL